MSLPSLQLAIGLGRVGKVSGLTTCMELGRHGPSKEHFFPQMKLTRTVLQIISPSTWPPAASRSSTSASMIPRARGSGRRSNFQMEPTMALESQANIVFTYHTARTHSHIGSGAGYCSFRYFTIRSSCELHGRHLLVSGSGRKRKDLFASK